MLPDDPLLINVHALRRAMANGFEEYFFSGGNAVEASPSSSSSLGGAPTLALKRFRRLAQTSDPNATTALNKGAPTGAALLVGRAEQVRDKPGALADTSAHKTVLHASTAP